MDVPDGVITLEEYPDSTDEYGWFDLIEQLGHMQWWTNHAMANGQIPDDAANQRSLEQTNQSLAFYGAHVADLFGLILPPDCPSGARSYKPGDKFDDFSRAYFSKDSGADCPEAMPYPPEGKLYWWQWYRKMNAFDETIQPELKDRRKVDIPERYADFLRRWDQTTESLNPA